MRDLLCTSAQSIHPTPLPTPQRAAHPELMQKRDELLGQFFGGGRLPSSKASQTNNANSGKPRPSMSSDVSDTPTLRTHDFRSKVKTLSLPTKEKDTESLQEGEYPTMMRHIFWYGFFFPPLWLYGAILLLVPLRPSPEWTTTNPKTPKEQSVLMERMRVAERRWGLRCLTAFVGFLVVIALVVLVVLFAKKR